MEPDASEFKLYYFFLSLYLPTKHLKLSGHGKAWDRVFLKFVIVNKELSIIIIRIKENLPE